MDTLQAFRPFARACAALLALTLSGRAWANAPVVTSAIKPVKIVQSTAGGQRAYFVDFGQAYFGSLSFKLNAASSATVESAISEAASGSDLITNAVGARSSTSSFTAAAGSQAYSRFTDQPIRACRLRMPDGNVTLDTASLVLNAKHVPFSDSASSFVSSDTALNRIYAFCKHTVKATSFMGVYLDGIRETKPYEGDAYINMLSHFAFDANPPVALFTHEYLLTNPTWPWEYRLISILIGWEHYLATGDQAQLQRNYQALTGRIQSCIGSGSWTDSAALVDWPEAMRDGYVVAIKGGTVANAWAYKAFMTIADMADALGKASEASAFRARAAQTKKRINDTLLIDGQGRYRDGIAASHVSLHGNLYPLALGVVPDSLKKDVGKYLVSRGMACNVYAAQFLLDALFEAGYDSAAIALMTARTGNSWGHMLYEVGATMTMEVWDPKQKPNLDWNHAWATAPANVIPRRVFGILPIKPGYAAFMIKPQVGTLTSGRYVLPTVKGSIAVAFESRRNQSLSITADVPAASIAKVYVPAYGSADAEVKVDGKTVAGTREGDFLYVDSLAPGRHTVERRNPAVALLPARAAASPGVRILAGPGWARFRALPGRGPAEIRIRDVRGRKIAAFALDGADRVLRLPAGLYLATVASPGAKPPESAAAHFLVH